MLKALVQRILPKRREFPLSDEFIELLKTVPLFDGVEHKTLTEIARCASLKSGEEIEALYNQTANALCYVVSGQLQGVEYSKGDAIDYRLKDGDLFPLSALIDNKVKFSIKSHHEVEIVYIDLERLRRFPGYSIVLLPLLLRNALVHYEGRFKEINILLTQVSNFSREEQKKRSLLGAFFVRMTACFCAYILFVNLFLNSLMKGPNSTVTSFFILLFIMSIAIELIVKSKLPLEQFGVTTKNWKPAVIQGVMVAVMLMGVGIALKYVLVKMHIYTSVFSYHHIDTHLIWLPLYILFVPIQELIVRGAIQGALYELVSDKERNRVIGSILLSNFMFSSFHAHISLFFVVIIFIPSVIWGYLYYRHKTLIGVTVSHILSGTFAIYALGFGF